jgi:hypothetical protein
MQSLNFSNVIDPFDSENLSQEAENDNQNIVDPFESHQARETGQSSFSEVIDPFSSNEPDAEIKESNKHYQEGIVLGTSVRRVDQAPDNKPEQDGIISASGKALENVPERMQMSVAGLVQMFGEDLSAEKERYISDKARRLGISSEDFKLLAWGGEQGFVNKSTPFNEALPDLKKNVASSLDKQQLEQLTKAGLFNPDEISNYGLELRKDAQSTLEPINTESGSAAYYASAAIGSLAEMAPMLAASILTRNPKIGALVMGGQVGGQAYGEGREQGLEPRETQHYAALTAAAEAVPEAVVVGKLLQSGSGIIKGFFKGSILEGSQEAVTAALQAGIDQQYIDPDMTFSEAIVRVRDGFIVGNLIGGPIGSVTAATNKIFTPMEAAQDQIKQAGAEVSEAGGDSLDVALGEIKKTSEVIPTALNETAKQSKAISQQRFDELKQQYRNVLTTPQQDRTEADSAIIDEYRGIDPGQIFEEETVEAEINPEQEYATITEAAPVNINTGETQDQLPVSVHQGGLIAPQQDQVVIDPFNESSNQAEAEKTSQNMRQQEEGLQKEVYETFPAAPQIEKASSADSVDIKPNNSTGNSQAQATMWVHAASQPNNAVGGDLTYIRSERDNNSLAESNTKLNSEGQNPEARYENSRPEQKVLFSKSKTDESLSPLQANRKAKNFKEARISAKEFQGRELINKETGINAKVSRNTLDKMLSGKAAAKSENGATHSAAVANVDEIFKNAALGWSKKDNSNDPNIAAIHRFFAPVEINNSVKMAKVTVKETVDSNLNNPLYSVEAVEFNEESSASSWIQAASKADGIDFTSARSAEDILNLAKRIEKYNADSSFSRSIDDLTLNQESSPSLSSDAVKAVTAKLGKRLRLRGVKISVVDTESSLPETIRQQAKEDGAEGTIDAVYHDKVMYIVADRMDSIAKIEESILHETAHFGGTALLGSELNKSYQKLALKLGGANGIRKKAAEYGFNMDQYFETADQLVKSGEMNIGERSEFLVDEFLAHASGAQAYKKLPERIKVAIQEFIGRVRDILRKLGISELAEVSDSDITFLLKKLRDAAKGKVSYADRPHFLSATDKDIKEIITNNIKEASSYRASFSTSTQARGAIESNSRGANSNIEPEATVNEEPELPAFETPTETNFSNTIRKFADKHRPLKEVQRSITNAGKIISDEADAYEHEKLFHGKTEEDLNVMEDQFVKPLAAQLKIFNISQRDLDVFLYAMHAPERNAYIASINPEMQEAGSGMTNKEAAAIIKDVNDSGKRDQYDQLAFTVYDMIQAQRDIIKDHGLEEEGVVNAWERKYKFYVPLKGFDKKNPDEHKAVLPKVGKGFSIGGRESKKALGRESRAGSPSSHAIIDLTEKIVRKRKNEVGQSLLKLVEENPNSSYWKVYTNESPEKHRKDVERVNKETGKKETIVKEESIPMAMMSDRYFTVKKNGQTHYIKIEDARLLKAMNNLGVEDQNSLITTLGSINRILSALNTSYNPEFMVGNFARDIQTAILNLNAEQSRDDGKVKGEAIVTQTVKDVPKAMRVIYRSMRGKSVKNADMTKYYDEFRADGAKTGYFDMKDLEGQQKSINNLISSGKGMKAAKSVAQFVEDVNGAVENAVRLSAYMNARKAGISRHKAAVLAKDMTVNFNKKGEYGSTLNAIFMFTNASIQGTANFARTMYGLNGKRADPAWSRLNRAQKLSMIMMTGAYGLSVFNRAVSEDDDDGVSLYDKIPDYVKERNIVIMKSAWSGKGDAYMKFPLPYGYNIFHVLGTSAEAVTRGKQPVLEQAKLVTLTALGSFSPIGFQSSDSANTAAIKNLTPTVLKPFVDVAVNENFMGSSIYRENFAFGAQKPESSLARKATPEVYKVIAEFMNEMSFGNKNQPGFIDINPDKMKYFVSYYSGGAGSFAFNKLPDTVSRWFGGMGLETHRNVFFRRFNGEVMPYKDVDNYYKRRDEVGQIEAEFKSLRGIEKLRFGREHKPKLNLRLLIKASNRQLRNVKKEREAVYARDLSIKARHKRLERIDNRRKEIIDRFNKAYKKASE